MGVIFLTVRILRMSKFTLDPHLSNRDISLSLEVLVT